MSRLPGPSENRKQIEDEALRALARAFIAAALERSQESILLQRTRLGASKRLSMDA